MTAEGWSDPTDEAVTSTGPALAKSRARIKKEPSRSAPLTNQTERNAEVVLVVIAPDAENKGPRVLATDDEKTPGDTAGYRRVSIMILFWYLLNSEGQAPKT